MAEFPKLKLEPDSYDCVIIHPAGQRAPARLDLSAGRIPRAAVFDWPLEPSEVYEFPQPAEHFPILKCD